MSKGSFRKLLKDIKFRSARVRIGDLLVQNGMITAVQLEEALAIQQGKGQGKFLGQIIAELGYITRDQLGLILAVQRGFPYIELSRCLVDRQVLELLSVEFVEKHLVFPVDRIGSVVTIAMVDPLNQTVVDHIEMLTKSSVMVFLTTRQELELMVGHCYSQK